MINRGLAIDISLLAVVIALHVTKKDKNLELAVLAILFAHVIMTTDAITQSPVSKKIGLDRLGSSKFVLGTEKSRGPTIEVAEADALDLDDSLVPPVNLDNAVANIDLTVNDEVVIAEPPLTHNTGDGEFERMFSVPKQASVTSVDVLPQNSIDANGKLADARTSFYKELFPNN